MLDVAPPRRRRSLALLPARVRAMRRPKWWQEIAFILICYWLYSLVRNAAPSHETSARERALSLMGLEHTLHIGFEQSLNSLVAGTSWLAYVCDYYYATLHFVVTISVLIWIYVKHPLRYRSIRSVLFATNLIALIGFWVYALAPPRMFASRGFTDTVVEFHTWGSYASGDLAKASNQFAAMPSLHIGWSLWCAIAIVALAERNWIRVLGALYPLATLFVVIGTANHYLLDVAGGVVAVALGFVVQRLLSGRPAFAHPTLATLHPSELATVH
ncbi:MAG TPA: phosphatase PAP2 family protein [Mycobacteriales bacterium]|nr:phosphatase PAP2 family protein [Mycobacteriales bacterium]